MGVLVEVLVEMLVKVLVEILVKVQVEVLLRGVRGGTNSRCQWTCTSEIL